MAEPGALAALDAPSYLLLADVQNTVFAALLRFGATPYHVFATTRLAGVSPLNDRCAAVASCFAASIVLLCGGCFAVRLSPHR